MSTSTSTSQYLASDETQKPAAAQNSNLHPYQNAQVAGTYNSEKSGMLYNPAAAASSTSLASTDPRSQDIKQWSEGFERMQDQRLQKQRYEMSGKKSDEVSITALGAKVERALGRRMTGQDAVFTPRRESVAVELPEKRSLEI